MFNTLTISLLERTHEVGMMKAMGVKSNEIQELFLTESMIMGVFGGLGGLVLGFITGKVVSVLLSLFAIFKGVGFLDIAYIPFGFVLLIAVLSVIVGLATGIYPSQRATKISALDALRYE
jgi:ABC-type antimicrobial peptide transport system permease subunit